MQQLWGIDRTGGRNRGTGDDLWAILLAAGDGRRVGNLTTDAQGNRVPKQFYELDERGSMFRWALDRAASLVPWRQVVTVVAARHRTWWEDEVIDMPARNVVVQPANRGTAPGILLPLMTVLQRCPTATVVILPTDHYVRDENALLDAIHKAVQITRDEDGEPVILGMKPETDDAEYGWIIPSPQRPGATPLIGRFLEKPDRRTARRLLRLGGLINSFITVAPGRSLVHLYHQALPHLACMFDTLRDRRAPTNPDLDSPYLRVPVCDFSEDVVQRFPGRFSVLPVPECGWSDLGTPARLRRFRQEVRSRTEVGRYGVFPVGSSLSLPRDGQPASCKV